MAVKILSGIFLTALAVCCIVSRRQRCCSHCQACLGAVRRGHHYSTWTQGVRRSKHISEIGCKRPYPGTLLQRDELVRQSEVKIEHSRKPRKTHSMSSQPQPEPTHTYPTSTLSTQHNTLHLTTHTKSYRTHQRTTKAHMTKCELPVPHAI